MDPGMTGMPEQHSGMGKMDMKMAFYWGRRVDLMFPGWSTHTVAQYVLSLVALFVLALFHQALTHVRTRLFDPDHGRNNQKDLGTKSLGTGIAETVAFAVNAGTGYLLMLAVMSYNVGVFVVILAGLSVGFFFFRSWKRSGVAAEVSPRSATSSFGLGRDLVLPLRFLHGLLINLLERRLPDSANQSVGAAPAD